VVESGNFNELMKLNGAFATLAKAQFMAADIPRANLVTLTETEDQTG